MQSDISYHGRSVHSVGILSRPAHDPEKKRSIAYDMWFTHGIAKLTSWMGMDVWQPWRSPWLGSSDMWQNQFFMNSFAQFNALRKNQLLAFYEELQPLLREALDAKRSTTKYRDYYFVAQFEIGQPERDERGRRRRGHTMA